MVGEAGVDFLHWLERHSERLLADSPSQNAEALFAWLGERGLPYSVEVADPVEGELGREVVISAAGDSTQFDSVRRFVASIPPVHGWRIVALKPPRGFEFMSQAEGLNVDVAKLKFDPLASIVPGEITIKIYVPESVRKHPERAVIVSSIIDHGLGEVCSARIGRILVGGLATAPTAALPICDLHQFVSWRLKSGNG